MPVIILVTVILAGARTVHVGTEVTATSSIFSKEHGGPMKTDRRFLVSISFGKRFEGVVMGDLKLWLWSKAEGHSSIGPAKRASENTETYDVSHEEKTVRSRNERRIERSFNDMRKCSEQKERIKRE